MYFGLRFLKQTNTWNRHTRNIVRENMGSVARRKNSRRRLAALTFLSNISLDGTHKDTPLGILNLNVQCSKQIGCKNNSNVSDTKKAATDGSENRQYRICHATRRLTISEGFEIKRSPRKDIWGSCDDKIACCDGKERPFSKSKERMHKFMCDTKARLSNLSQKRKHLVHQKTMMESFGMLPSGLSTENLTYVSQSRKSSIVAIETGESDLEMRRSKSFHERHSQNERLILVSSGKSPFLIFSLLPFRRRTSPLIRCDTKIEGGRRRHNSSLRQLPIISDGPDPLDLLALLGIEKADDDDQDISFAHFLTSAPVPKRCRSLVPEVERHQASASHHTHSSGCMSFDQVLALRQSTSSAAALSPPISVEKASLDHSDVLNTSRHSISSVYNPNLLDDPELVAGKHSILLTFPSYVTSVINYVKPGDLKKDLNDKFKERFPHVRLTLSKLRSIKKEMHRIGRNECNMDLAVVAQAFVYFEKLILRMLVNKQNRKLCAGACLLLSAKLNDVKGTELRMLLEKIETVFRVNRKDLIRLEFQVLVALKFSLHLSQWDVLPHYQRLVYAS